ncbi:diphthine-ammonia ligase [Nanobdella aerobiophila]|uniref:Diphthine-ammonia ligase n=1 Tax=Nanobdella aerobiophila TaxID=2586965 RepID=A0A915SAL0_9ARCH|nr:diphthine--ammonia ligase [Nanobdella aerobiophila]BBL45847.1 diphthine-ammonia ligase [Nanobdella aerobiophila]
MNLAVLYSGGKDSNYSLFITSKYYKVSVLLNIIPKNNESYLYQYINNKITLLQAKALSIDIYRAEVNESEEKTLKEALIYLKKEYNIDGLVTGAIRSTYQGSKFQKICKDLKLWCFNPIWLINEKIYIKELIKNNFEFIITGWYSYPLDIDILGKKVNTYILNKLIEYNKKYGINIAGEGGEYETIVLYQPLFKKRINIEKYRINIEKNYAEYIIEKASLI